MIVKEKSEKAGLKLNIQKTKIMASGPITSWQIVGETRKAAKHCFLGLKITGDGDWSHEIKTFAPWKKSYNKLRHCIKKQRHYFAKKDPYSQGSGFPLVMYGCKSWIIKKAECWRIDAFELWCWRRLLKFPQAARWSNQSILKGINTEYSLEVLMLKLKLRYFGHLMRRTDWCWESLKVGGERDNRARNGWITLPTQWTWVWASSGSSWRTGKPGVLQSVVLQRVRHDWVIEQQIFSIKKIMITSF